MIRKDTGDSFARILTRLVGRSYIRRFDDSWAKSINKKFATFVDAWTLLYRF